MAATARIPLLVTPTQKMQLVRKARASNLTVNEFVRRAAEAYDPTDDDPAWDRLIEQIKITTHEATTALDAALRSCEASNKRIASMEAAHATRRDK
jgi:hypothetical protein